MIARQIVRFRPNFQVGLNFCKVFQNGGTALGGACPDKLRGPAAPTGASWAMAISSTPPFVCPWPLSSRTCWKRRWAFQVSWENSHDDADFLRHHALWHRPPGSQKTDRVP